MSLRRHVRQRILDDMVGSVEGECKVLIADKYALQVLGACCKNADVMSHKVSVIESIHISRQPLPVYPAIYFLSPSVESVNLLIADWEEGRPYHSAHLFFTSRVTDILMGKIGRSKIGKSIKTFMEINVDFLCMEAQVANFKLEHDLFQFFGPRKATFQEQHSQIADQAVAFCLTVKEFPIIRYQNSQVASSVARLVQEKLDAYLKINPKFRDEYNENRGTLIILDRSVDVVAPILHEFTYQAMLFDLLQNQIMENRYVHKFENSQGKMCEREVIVDESDNFWSEHRHRHIAEVKADITKSFHDFVESHKSISNVTKEKGTDLKKVGEAVRGMAMYQEKMNKFSLHIGITERLMDIFSEKHLSQLAYTEQLMATGEYPDGSKAGEKELRKEVERHLQDPAVSTDNKLRMLLLYVVSQGGLKEATRTELIEMANFGPRETFAVNNLVYFDVTVDKEKKRGLFNKSRKKKSSRGGNKDDAYDISRYVPTMKAIVESESSGKLSPADFPYTKEPASSNATSTSKDPITNSSQGKSLRGARVTQWVGSRNSLSNATGEDVGKYAGPKMMVFMAGGATYSELRSVYELSKELKREVLMCTTRVLTPQVFMDSLIQIGAT